MSYWRMAFREGDRGPSKWEECRNQGIAAIGYYYNKGKPIVRDCSNLTEKKYDNIWRKKRPNPGTARQSLKYVAYRMRRGDIIYVKEGPKIVGKGKITKKYKYDPNILKDVGSKWEHYVTVDWEEDFPQFECLLGSEPSAVLPLKGKRLEKILKLDPRERKKFEKESEEMERLGALEGERSKKEITWRYRNGSLIVDKKRQSNYRCEVCDMSYEEVYGDVGTRHIIAHHMNPIGSRKRASQTTLDDIALVCSNCHDMLHREEPPKSINNLRSIYSKRRIIGHNPKNQG